MAVDNHLLGIFTAMTKEKTKWSEVTPKQKSEFFFILNRMCSKKYPDLSQLLNQKEIDKSVGMDLWQSLFRGLPYPAWFWSKSAATKKSDPNSEIELMSKHLGLKESEARFLKKHYPDDWSEEVKYIKNLNNIK